MKTYEDIILNKIKKLKIKISYFEYQKNDQMIARLKSDIQLLESIIDEYNGLQDQAV